MATSARGSGTVGYNVQTAVDAKHHLVVTHEVTNQGTDRAQAVLDGPARLKRRWARRSSLPWRPRLLRWSRDPQVRTSRDQRTGAEVPYVQQSWPKGSFDKRDFLYTLVAMSTAAPLASAPSGA